MSTAGVDARLRLPGWLFLTLFGFTGMMLSEALSWNVGPLVKASAQGWPGVFRLLLITTAGYILLLAGFVAVIEHHRVRSVTGLLLLGSIYGLINEGVFADLVFRAGGLPKVFGLHLDRLLFPTLSWHALIDFTGGMLLVRFILDNRARLNVPGLTGREVLGILSGSVFWFSWTQAKWMAVLHPAGIPLAVQGVVLVFALTGLGALLSLAAGRTAVLDPSPVLSPRALRWWVILMFVLALARGGMIPGKARLVGFGLVLMCYVGLFLLHRKAFPGESALSVVSEVRAAPFAFNIWKYLQVCGVVVAGFALFQGLMLLAWFPKLCARLSVLMAILMMLCALLLPPAVLVRILFRRGSPPAGAGSTPGS